MLATRLLAAGEISENTLLLYIGGLTISGIILLLLAATGLGGMSNAQRVINGLIGIAMLGYGAYLFIGNPETVVVLWYVFVVPILLIVQAFRHARATA